MNARAWLYLIAASGHLTLGVLALVRGRRSPIARPLALLCFDMFAWCFASLAYVITNVSAWSLVDSIFTALTPPLALHLVATFVGGGRAIARVVAAAYALFGALALSTALAFVAPAARAWVDSAAWSVAFLAAWAPALALVLALLVRHLARSSDPDEKARTRLVLAALAVGGAIAPSDLVSATLGADFLRLAPLGTFAGTLLVATAVFRVRLFDRDLSRSTAVYAAALALAGVLAYLGVFALLGGSVAAVASGTAVVTLVLGAAAREVAASRATERERVERLATLGRFSNQMAHDMKNPLATLKGALQFLQEERNRGASFDPHHELVGVMLDQVERLNRVVDDYQRIGRVQPVRREVDVNALVRGVVALEPHAADGVAIRAELAGDLPRCELDGDLVTGALHNLIRNAVEAMPKGGTLTVRTERAGGFARGGVSISVEDAGAGMDARQAARAFDDFFTTKANGSGLGLAFVRRVAQAHGGDVSLKSKVGAGTIVRLTMSAT